MAISYMRSFKTVTFPKEIDSQSDWLQNICRRRRQSKEGLKRRRCDRWPKSVFSQQGSEINNGRRCEYSQGRNRPQGVAGYSEYPEWLDKKKPALSELRRKDLESLPYEELKRFVKLDNRARRTILSRPRTERCRKTSPCRRRTAWL
ncbi:unnamed protein product [Cuscuta campestris]|uniref:Uncharacterized protein n=1 Tax=Cuscuta campestris TaxID=132261 RepID=A0A484KS57_9ASTE|nr:unnamed protein product [Cuscuta campestris]